MTTIISTSSKGQIRVARTEFQNKEYVDIRSFYQSSDGEWLPTKKGIMVQVGKVDELIAALVAENKPAASQHLYAVLLFAEEDLAKFKNEISVPSTMCFVDKHDAKKPLKLMRNAGYEDAFLCKISYKKCDDRGGAKVISSPKYKVYDY